LIWIFVSNYFGKGFYVFGSSRKSVEVCDYFSKALESSLVLWKSLCGLRIDMLIARDPETSHLICHSELDSESRVKLFRFYFKTYRLNID